jgi:hypothetical protein
MNKGLASVCVAGIACLICGSTFADTPHCKAGDYQTLHTGNPSDFLNRYCSSGGAVSGHVVLAVTLHRSGGVSDITAMSAAMTPNQTGECASQAAVDFIKHWEFQVTASMCTTLIVVSFERKP